MKSILPFCKSYKVSFIVGIVLFPFVCFCYITGETGIASNPEDSSDCIVCERINIFVRSKELVSNNVWEGLNSDTHMSPLLYFTDSSTYVAFARKDLFKRFNYELLECKNGVSLLKLPRIDTQAFHMENSMNFKDTASLYYHQPMMLCSDVETLIKVVPDFNKTEDWLQLVMHEYFHSFQFSHKNTLNYLADSIQISADTLNNIYMQNEWFRQSLEIENQALIDAFHTATSDSLSIYISHFLETRRQRRLKYEELFPFNLTMMENFWETIEGTARYVEYYLAGNFHMMTIGPSDQCDSLFKHFSDYAEGENFESKQEFVERTKMMRAYYYVTGFNLCRLMDKLNISYRPSLFDHPATSLFEIFERNTSR